MQLNDKCITSNHLYTHLERWSNIQNIYLFLFVCLVFWLENVVLLAFKLIVTDILIMIYKLLFNKFSSSQQVDTDSTKIKVSATPTGTLLVTAPIQTVVYNVTGSMKTISGSTNPVDIMSSTEIANEVVPLIYDDYFKVWKVPSICDFFLVISFFKCSL